MGEMMATVSRNRTYYWLPILAVLACVPVGCGKEVDTVSDESRQPTADEFEYLCRQADKVFQKLGTVGFDQLNHAQQVFVCAWSVDGEVGNGGFDQFYFNTSGDWALETVDALDSIGAPRMATLVRRGNELFPNGIPAKDRKKRQRDLDGLSKKSEDDMAGIETEFEKDRDKIQILLFAYIRAHANEL